MKNLRTNIILLFILCLGFILRSQFVNWDQGFHLHPDERMLLIVADRLHFWDQLNPEFFSYGSLPIYILKAISQASDYFFHTTVDSYDGMLIVGRYLSVLFDTATIFLIYKTAQLIFNKKNDHYLMERALGVSRSGTESVAITISLFAAFFYAISFFPIQNSHFFVVDVFLTFFLTCTLYFLLRYIFQPRLKTVIIISFFFACALTTKITAIIYAPFIVLTILGALIVFGNKKHRDYLFILKTSAKYILFLLLCTLFWTVIFMPYAWLDYKAMFQDLSQQTKMRQDAYLFPYTLQYVGSIPYWYYLKNIFLWGIGPVIGLLSLIGISQLKKGNFRITKQDLWSWINRHTLQIVFILFYLYYFLLIGNSAVKFMRYMLPLYPFLTIMAGVGIASISRITNYGYRIAEGVAIFLSVVWLLFFLNIYSVPTTRIQANDWILKNIPFSSHILVEHWDDRLPLTDSQQYDIQELTLYDQPDNSLKWLTLNQKLLHTDYIIIASNRLYVPLQRLTNCTKYRVCYPLTAIYYEKLLHNKPIDTEFGPIHFKKLKEFTSYPNIQLFGKKLQIFDDGADESFTVYDHPKIMIFKKVT